jgi:hypothetical protein
MEVKKATAYRKHLVSKSTHQSLIKKMKKLNYRSGHCLTEEALPLSLQNNIKYIDLITEKRLKRSMRKTNLILTNKRNMMKQKNFNQ